MPNDKSAKSAAARKAQDAGDWTFKRSRVNELAAAIEPGHLVYVEPTPTGNEAETLAARRGEVPGFAELRERLAARGITLTNEGAFYWRATEASR